jgi:hypothetical protein
VLLGLALSLSCSFCVLAQSGLDGYWEYRVPNGGVSFFSLKQSGETVRSTNSDRGATFVGTLHDNKLRLAASINYKGEPFTIILDGTRQSPDEFEATEATPGVTAREVLHSKGVLRRVDRDAV